MEKLNLKPTHKPIKDYYKALEQYDQYDLTHEGTVSNPFAILLDVCAKRVKATFAPQYPMRTKEGKRIVLDGAIIDEYRRSLAYWEAKDIDDDLSKAIQEKRDKDYPFDNILFQTPERAILFQDDQEILNTDITESQNLVETLQRLFSYSDTTSSDWYDAVGKFSDRIPALADRLKKLIAEQHKANSAYKAAFAKFYQTCQNAIDPNLSQDTVEEMLIQHILTERIFRKIFDRSDFTNRNIIAVEIERVSAALMQYAMSRDEFLKPLDPFYIAIEQAATQCKDFSEKQHFLNTVYEKFFQEYCVKKADTQGIFYTPQPIVDFMVNSVEHLLQREFNRSLSDTGVHIIDPFVGTGNFIVRLMQDIRKTALEEKYQNELHCNENELLPYYIANLNIEQEFWKSIGKYRPFEGIAFADTFELFDQAQMSLLSEENTKRVDRQKEKDMFVVIGNPPYNAGQDDENQNNKNREYPPLDKQIKDTYSKDSIARLGRKLYDHYVRAFFWASERIGDSGIVVFVTNNSFITERTFDGMRKHLAEGFNAVYLLNLGGDIRKGQPGDSNVFGITIGVSITLLVKTGEPVNVPCIFYNNETELQSKAQTFDFLNRHQNISEVTWQEIQPDDKNRWLTEGLQEDFDDLIPMGTREAKDKEGTAETTEGVIFKNFSLGVSTNRDPWVYNFNKDSLRDNVERMIETYNAEVDRYMRLAPPKPDVDDFVLNDATKIKWSRDLKEKKLMYGRIAKYADDKIKSSLYRPFTKASLFLDKILIDSPGQFPSIFPNSEAEKENRVICVEAYGRKEFAVLMSNLIPNVNLYGDPQQSFPFYTYNEDGTNRRENITDWALAEFKNQYGDDNISKWDIFYYTYGLLHHKGYRDKYREDLKDSLPHIPFTEDFWAFAEAGKQLANLHVNYESVSKYEGLTLKEKPNTKLNWSVEKMTFENNNTQIKYNDFLTIEGIPAEAHDYKLGSWSALKWIENQYQIKVDKDTKNRKGSYIERDPNSEENPKYIVDLIARVVTVSLETVKIIKSLPELYPDREN
ncbi:MAG: N-6 DNA methylase [Candidatus Poribacteria bacterium]|nr:N-6 DNA methylase [Candidatus Poribacteria bacterium]